MGQLLYDKLIVAIRSTGAKYLWSDHSMSSKARKAWERLSKRYEVLKINNRYRLTIPVKEPRKKLKEDPDFGYENFKNRDEDINKLVWTVKTPQFKRWNADGETMAVIVSAENPETHDVEGFISSDQSSIDPSVLQIGRSELRYDDKWQSTGLGQMLYDKLIQEAKKLGFKYVCSDYILSPKARKAWQKLSSRYEVTRFYNEDYEKCYRIDLSKI